LISNFYIFYEKIKLNKIIGFTFSNLKLLDETSLVFGMNEELQNRIIS